MRIAEAPGTNYKIAGRMPGYSLSSSELNSIYGWADQLKSSRPKKNFTRDFSDGVLAAELLNWHLPGLVEVHNYVQASSVRRKRDNWKTLNSKFANPDKVLKKLGCLLSDGLIDDIVKNVPEAAEFALLAIRKKVEAAREGQTQGLEQIG